MVRWKSKQPVNESIRYVDTKAFIPCCVELSLQLGCQKIYVLPMYSEVLADKAIRAKK